jgi:hypothetical protein
MFKRQQRSKKVKVCSVKPRDEISTGSCSGSPVDHEIQAKYLVFPFFLCSERCHRLALYVLDEVAFRML